ncbi:MAG: hypothetical protein AAGL89_08730 [Pseudomonadota bacterium]
MTRHIIDRSHTPSATKRAAKFVRIERGLKRQSASPLAHKRPAPSGTGRLRHYLRIERGRLA